MVIISHFNKGFVDPIQGGETRFDFKITFSEDQYSFNMKKVKI